jgi:hypothetical protein
MVDRIGDGILEYGTKAGYFENSNDPHQFVGNVVKFFLENRYISNITVNQTGDTLEIGMQNWRFLPIMRKLRERNSYLLTCPVCMANNSITKAVGGISERLSENLTPDGDFSMKVKMLPGTRHVQASVISAHPADFTKTKLNGQLNETVGLPAFETVAYGLAYGFEYLGAQAQLLLDNVGKGMLEFMREETNINFSHDLGNSLETLSTFMSGGGLANAIHPRTSGSAMEVDFETYRYIPVLKKLMEEGRLLVSCPFTLAARALIQERGLATGEMKWQISTEDAKLTIPIIDAKNKTFDEEAMGNLMDQA